MEMVRRTLALGKGELLMWTYNKTLQYPINIKCPDPRLAKVIISQYGGPDGELAASLRYLSQRFGMPDQKAKAILNDIGTEELAHLEMVGTIVHQLTDGASIEEIEKAGLAPYYTDHGVDIYPQSAAGVPESSSRRAFDATCRQHARHGNWPRAASPARMQ